MNFNKPKLNKLLEVRVNALRGGELNYGKNVTYGLSKDDML